jgi:hypothetical protein
VGGLDEAKAMPAARCLSPMIGWLVIRNRLVWHESNPSVVGAITWRNCFMFNEMFTHLLQLFSFVYIACILLAKGCWKKTLSVHKPLEKKQSHRLLEYNVEFMGAVNKRSPYHEV